MNSASSYIVNVDGLLLTADAISWNFLNFFKILNPDIFGLILDSCIFLLLSS